MKCNNCNSTLSCGCQRQTARDGKSCCNKCIASYNKSILPNNQSNVAQTLVKGSNKVSAYFTLKK